MSPVEILYAALASPIGVLAFAEDIEAGKQALYRARAAARDDALAELQIRCVTMRGEANLAITRRHVSLARALD